MALDTIVVSRAFDYDEDELRRASRIAFAIEQALAGDIELKDIVAARSGRPGARQKTFPMHPEVTIDNSLSNRLTVVEVSGLDRPGLLFDLTTALSRLDLNIGSAHIATFGEKAADVFYVTDLGGDKITAPVQHELIRKSLLQAFDLSHEEPAPAV
jgi:[protein-PII] uridylyltransferase